MAGNFGGKIQIKVVISGKNSEMLSTALALQHSVPKHMQTTNLVTHREMSSSQQFLGSFFHIVHVYTKITFSVFK